jgi:cytochrome c peroxidase
MQIQFFKRPIKKLDLFCFLICFFLLTYSCISRKNKSSDKTFSPEPYSINVPLFPDYVNIPEDNPMTKAGVELGRYLFYDGRLSGNTEKSMLMSCASCHKQTHAFEAGLDNPLYKDGHMHGITGKQTPHSMLPLINLAWNSEGYLWNGMINMLNVKLGSEAYKVPAQKPFDFQNIESLVWMGIVAPHEMNGNVDRTVAVIKSEKMYPPMFAKAFGSDTISIDRICKAVAQFVRSLVSANSRFDQYMEGKVKLNDAELNGLNLFTSEKADCFHCHGAPAIPLWTTNRFLNNAKDTIFNDKYDRRIVTGVEDDKGKYRVPTLRNIALTAPYMHDGRFTTLRQVLEFYNGGLQKSDYTDPLMKYTNRGGVHLSEKELDDLEAFLNTLTDSSFITNPAFSNPMPRNKFFIQ